MLDEKGLLEKAKNRYLRFTDEQIEQQRYELAIYLLTELSNDDIDSIKESIDEVKRITGFDVSVEEALQIRKMVAARKAELDNDNDHDHETMFDKDKSIYYRFSEEQLKQQKHDLAVYILSRLDALDDVYSVERGIDDVRRITGIDVSIEEALKIRRDTALTKEESTGKTR